MPALAKPASRPAKTAAAPKPKPKPAAAKPKAAAAGASHPPYFEMIKEAITALKERNGSSSHAIAKYMEDKHGPSLPANYKKMLSIQLRGFAAKGKLVKVKASYKLSDAAKEAPKAKPVAAKTAAAKPAKAGAKPKKSAAAAKPKKTAAAAAGTKRKAPEKKVVAKPKKSPAAKAKAKPKTVKRRWKTEVVPQQLAYRWDTKATPTHPSQSSVVQHAVAEALDRGKSGEHQGLRTQAERDGEPVHLLATRGARDVRRGRSPGSTARFPSYNSCSSDTTGVDSVVVTTARSGRGDVAA
ncbi:hypothetical protein C2845_PM16G16750 [Panicum miliaceum]|uniref:H15 domain-containing protein n=1 Tax=Panicum miliaceum TaxID=4540 RepID=A0A3L6PUP0_PANMI|nr:hypothetical protein C2845_PM16G16750 [Panicum miliaceum]